MALIGRNNQAQYYQLGGEALETIKPLSSQYGLMGIPKSTKAPKMETEDVNGLYQQSSELIKLGGAINSDIQTATALADNIIKNYGSIESAKGTSDYNDFAEIVTKINTSKMLYQAAQGTFGQNYNTYQKERQDISSDQTGNIAFWGDNIVVGGIPMSLYQFFNFEKKNKETGKTEKVDILPNDVFNVGQSQDFQNNYLGLFNQDGTVNQYNMHKHYNLTAFNQQKKDYASVIGKTTTVTGTNRKDYGGDGVVFSVEVTNKTSDNINQVGSMFQAMIGKNPFSEEGFGLHVGPTDFNTMGIEVALLNDYKDYLKQYGAMPILAFDPIVQDVEVKDEKTGQTSKIKQTVGFTAKYVLKDGKPQLTSALNNRDGYESYKIARSIGWSNAQIETEILNTSRATASATGNKKDEEYESEHINALLGTTSREITQIDTVQNNNFLKPIMDIVSSPNFDAYVKDLPGGSIIINSKNNIIKYDEDILNNWDEYKKNQDISYLKNISQLKQKQLSEWNKIKRNLPKGQLYDAIVANINNEINKSNSFYSGLSEVETGTVGIFGTYYKYSTDEYFVFGNSATAPAPKGKGLSMDSRTIYVGASNTELKLGQGSGVDVISYQGMLYSSPDMSQQYTVNGVQKYYHQCTDEERAIWYEKSAENDNNNMMYQHSIARIDMDKFNKMEFVFMSIDKNGKQIRQTIKGQDIKYHPRREEIEKQVGIVFTNQSGYGPDIDPNLSNADEIQANRKKYMYINIRHKPIRIQSNSYLKGTDKPAKIKNYYAASQLKIY